MEIKNEGSGKEEGCCSKSGNDGGCGCGSSGCGGGCGKSKSCCGTKGLFIVLFFLIGGLIGYLMGSHCSRGGMKACHSGMMPADCPMSAPAK